MSGTEMGRRQALVALAGVDGVGPALLRKMAAGDPLAEWRRLGSRGGDPEALWERARSEEGWITMLGDADYPSRLADDPEAPVVLFGRGRLPDPERPVVAVVGTRRSSAYGRRIAGDLGRDLAEAGVTVVSGLARGIDSCAHRGALSVEGAGVLGIVGSGLDVVYPPEHRFLWQQIVDAGALVSEAPPGSPPLRWRFPARNRIMAAWAHVVVVVESDVVGGSMHTVREAEARDRPVLAVPGPITAPSSSGCNQLLAEGCHPCLGVDDVLVALALVGAVPAPREPGEGDRQTEVTCGREPEVGDRVLLDAFGWGRVTLEELVLRSGLGVAEVATRCQVLAAAGWVEERSGWWERCR